jgi:hypothetical protein
MRGRSSIGSNPLPDVPTGAAPPDTAQLGGRKPLTRPKGIRSAHVERRTVLLIVAVVVSFWVVATFARALTEANALAARQVAEQQVNDALQRRVDAGKAELAYVASTPFFEFAARGQGMGTSAEHAFALTSPAPSPKAITPLGGTPAPAQASTPLDDWLRLLFGS